VCLNAVGHAQAGAARGSSECFASDNLQAKTSFPTTIFQIHLTNTTSCRYFTLYRYQYYLSWTWCLYSTSRRIGPEPLQHFSAVTADSSRPEMRLADLSNAPSCRNADGTAPDVNHVDGAENGIEDSVLPLTLEERIIEKGLVRKLDCTLMLVLFLNYIFNYLDRNNIA
jgi:hypothetical protein